MVTLLVHDPWVQCYLVLVGTLSIAFIWDYLRQPGRPGRRQKNPPSVSKAEKWPD